MLLIVIFSSAGLGAEINIRITIKKGIICQSVHSMRRPHRKRAQPGSFWTFNRFILETSVVGLMLNSAAAPSLP